MQHVTKAGEQKVLLDCSCPLTARRTVTRVITEFGVFDLIGEAYRVIELAPGVTLEEARAATGAPLVDCLLRQRTSGQGLNRAARGGAMRGNISDVTTPKRLGTGQFLLDVADGWQQGRGAFGGLVLGALARAMETELCDPSRPLRTLSGELVGAAQPGEGRLKVEILRSGKGLSLVEARLEQ